MKADLHIHTHYSYDSTASPKEIIETAIKKGVDCLAICDHGQVKGALETIEFAKDKPVLIIPGIEIKSKEGDILGLNIKEIIPNKLSARETVERINKSGGLAVIPHPFGWSCSFRGDLKKLVSEAGQDLAIEVFNASIFSAGNKKAAEIVKNYNLAFTCGSDAHFPNFIGRAYLEIPGENLSLKEVLEMVKGRKCSIHGSETNFFEKVIDHTKRNLVKFKFLI